MRNIYTSFSPPARRQQGSALFVSLVFLLVLTFLGMASMNDTIMQTKMSAALQDSNIAFQTVEVAAREAEGFIEASVNTSAYDNTKHLFTAGSVPTDLFKDSTWVDANTLEAGSTLTGVNAPRYFIELLGSINDGDTATALVIDTYSHESGTGTILGFRVVARSTGATGVTRRLVESYYGKRF
jgi:type IV pilus assembly protein PilX